MLKPPSLARIVGTDSLAFSSAVVAPVLWGFYLAALLLRPSVAADWFYPWLPIVVTGLGLAVLLWRVQLIRGVFTAGVEAPATVKHVSSTRGGKTRVDFVYSHAGREHFGGNTVNDTRYTRTLKPGDTVVLVLDPSRPQVSFLRDVYR